MLLSRLGFSARNLKPKGGNLWVEVNLGPVPDREQGFFVPAAYGDWCWRGNKGLAGSALSDIRMVGFRSASERLGSVGLR